MQIYKTKDLKQKSESNYNLVHSLSHYSHCFVLKNYEGTNFYIKQSDAQLQVVFTKFTFCNVESINNSKKFFYKILVIHTYKVQRIKN